MAQGYAIAGSAFLRGRVRITDLAEPPTDLASGSVATTRNYVDERTGMVGYGDTSAAPQPISRYTNPYTVTGGAQHITCGSPAIVEDDHFVITCSNNGNGTVVNNMTVPFNPQKLFQDTNASLGSVIITGSRVSNNVNTYSTAIVLSAVGSAFRRITLNFANVTLTSDAITVPTQAVHLSTDEVVTSPTIPVGGTRLYVSRGSLGISLYNMPSLPATTLNNPGVTIAGNFNVSQIYTLTTEAARYLLCGSSTGLSVYDVTTLTIGAAVASIAVASLTDIYQVTSGANKYCYAVSGSTRVYRVDLVGTPAPTGLSFTVQSAAKTGALYKSVIATVQSGTLRVYACDAQTGNAGPCIDVYTEGLTLTTTVRSTSSTPINYLSLSASSNNIWCANNLGIEGFSLLMLNSLSGFNIDALGRLSVGITRITTTGETVSQNSTCVIIPATVGGALSLTLPNGAVPGHMRYGVNLGGGNTTLVAGANKVYNTTTFALTQTNITLPAGSSCQFMWDGTGWLIFAATGGASTS
jgi:hypothetical protein